MKDETFWILLQIAEELKDRMESLGVTVPELSIRSGISESRIRRILRAQNSQVKLKTITTLAYHLALKIEWTSEDIFRSAVRKGMEEAKKDREIDKPLSEFKERYKIKRM